MPANDVMEGVLLSCVANNGRNQWNRAFGGHGGGGRAGTNAGVNTDSFQTSSLSDIAGHPRIWPSVRVTSPSRGGLAGRRESSAFSPPLVFATFFAVAT